MNPSGTWFKKRPIYKNFKLKLGSKKLQKHCDGYMSYWVKPGTKEDKRRANKKVRRLKDVPNGNYFKKVWDWFEWS